MKILITGALGYISLHFINEFIKYQNDLILIDNLSNSSIDNLKKINISCPFYQLDIRDETGMRNIFKNHSIEMVIHFAGLKSVSESKLESLLYYDNNILGTINLLKIMKEFNCKKMIFSSTACVYRESNEPHDENEKINLEEISNPYGKSKFIIEQILKDYSTSYGLDCIVLRYFNPVGILIPNISFSKSVSNLMDKILSSIVNNEKIFIFGNDYDTKDGTCIRDFIHIYDLISGHIKSFEYIKTKETIGVEIFNLGCGTGISVLELIQTFCKVNNFQLNYEFTKRREGDISISISDTKKSKNILKWQVTKTLEDMCMDSFKNNI